MEIKNKKILFLVISSKTHVHHDLNIDRVDLTRRMDAINTWVGDALHKGHDVVFVVGGSETVWYDDNSRTLHLNVSDEYENSVLSNLFEKGKSGLKWCLENKDFDVLYTCDDDVYINLEQFLKIEMTHDYMSTGSFGGGGFFLNKKSIQSILNFENKSHKVADHAIYNAIQNDSTITKDFQFKKSAPFYVPGELYATIHYVTGKRSYYLHNIFRFFNENGYTNRKIILGGPLNSRKLNEVVTYESTIGRKSCRWYDYIMDPNGWEYHGGYPRSHIIFNNLINFWPYAENATKFFVINTETMLKDFIGTSGYKTNLDKLVTLCENSLIDKNNILICSSKEENIDGWVLDNSVKESYSLNFEHLNDYNFYKKTS